MKLRIYSVFDVKAAAFATPFCMQNDAIAVRTLSDIVNDPQTTLFRHPEDYMLYFCGEFDDDTGSIVSELPKAVATAASVKRLPREFIEDLAKAVPVSIKELRSALENGPVKEVVR